MTKRHSLILPGCLLFAALMTSHLAGQDKNKPKGIGNDKPSPANLTLRFQLLNTNGTEIFLVNDVADRTKPPTTVTYSVKVPVVETRLIDGKTVQVTVYRTEERTRIQRPTIRRLIPIPPLYKFRQLDGKILSKIEMVGKLGMGSGKMVIMLNPFEKLSPKVVSQLKPDTLVIYVPK